MGFSGCLSWTNMQLMVLFDRLQLMIRQRHIRDTSELTQVNTSNEFIKNKEYI